MADGFIIVFSVTSSTCEYCEEYYNHVLRVKDRDDFPTVLVGAKCDIEEERMIPYTKGTEIGEYLKLPYIEVSSKYDINVNEVFEQLVSMIRKEKRIYEKDLYYFESPKYKKRFIMVEFDIRFAFI